MQNKIKNCLIRAKTHAREGNKNAAIDCIKEALVLDPGEMLITEILLSLEREYNKPPPPVTKKIKTKKATEQISTIERISSQPMDAKLEKIFQLSEKAREAGDDVKAIAYLKKARKLYPDNPAVEEKLQSLKTLVGASNMVLIGLKALDSENIPKAVSASRKAFNLDPDANHLQELITRLEDLSKEATERPEETKKAVKEKVKKVKENVTSKETINEEMDEDSPEGEALLWADRVRRAVQDDEFEEAGKMVTNAIKKFPNDELLNSFYSKLKRLGFAR